MKFKRLVSKACLLSNTYDKPNLLMILSGNEFRSGVHGEFLETGEFVSNGITYLRPWPEILDSFSRVPLQHRRLTVTQDNDDATTRRRLDLF